MVETAGGHRTRDKVVEAVVETAGGRTRDKVVEAVVETGSSGAEYIAAAVS